MPRQGRGAEDGERDFPNAGTDEGQRVWGWDATIIHVIDEKFG